MIPKTGNVLESLLSDRTARVMGGLAAWMRGREPFETGAARRALRALAATGVEPAAADPLPPSEAASLLLDIHARAVAGHVFTLAHAANMAAAELTEAGR